MNTRVAVISIIVEDPESTGELNAILHDYRQYVVGRMGIPYREKNVAIICVVVDAPMDDINALSGKLGKLKGVATKIALSGVGK